MEGTHLAFDRYIFSSKAKTIIVHTLLDYIQNTNNVLHVRVILETIRIFANEEMKNRGIRIINVKVR